MEATEMHTNVAWLLDRRRVSFADACVSERLETAPAIRDLAGPGGPSRGRRGDRSLGWPGKSAASVPPACGNWAARGYTDWDDVLDHLATVAERERLLLMLDRFPELAATTPLASSRELASAWAPDLRGPAADPACLSTRTAGAAFSCPEIAQSDAR